MSTLICLLSDQLVPNLLSCKILNPEQVLLIETEQMKKKMASRNFLRALNCMGISISHKIVDVPAGMDNDFPSLKNFFCEQLLESYAKDSFCLNLTGGTKPMSIALYDTFRKVTGADFFYFDVQHPNEIIDFRTNRQYSTGYEIPMQAFLAGYGFKFDKNMRYIEEAEKKARNRQKTTRILAQHCDPQEFRIWSKSKEAYAWRQKAMKHLPKRSTIPAGALCPTIPEVRNAIAECFGLHIDPSGNLIGELFGWDVQYLDGGWLEEFIWNTLREFSPKYGLRDLHLGIMVRPADNDTNNELDVSFMRNNMLYVMECKTGFQEKIVKPAPTACFARSDPGLGVILGV